MSMTAFHVITTSRVPGRIGPRVDHTMRRLCAGIGLSCVLALGLTSAQRVEASASDATLEADREHFLDARYALRKGQRQRFATNLAAIGDDYPLKHYLIYERLRDDWRRRNPGSEAITELSDFARDTSDTVLVGRLTRYLQGRFAETGRWPQYLTVAQAPDATDLPCADLRARHETGQLDGFDEAAVDLWVAPERQPSLCRSVLERLERQETPPLTAIWEKIFTAIEADHVDIAEAQLRYLGTRDRNWVEQWIIARRNPEDTLRSGAYREDTVLNRRIVADLVQIWSRREPDEAMEFWLERSPDYVFFDDRFYDTSRALAMRGAYRRLPEAHRWLASFEARPDDLELMEWRVRAALLDQDWPAVLDAIARLPSEEQAEDHWLYWIARAYEETGRAAEADPIYRELAEWQSFHGFLAADRVDLPYSIRDEVPKPAPGVLERLEADPQLARAREYRAVGLTSSSRSEWRAAMETQSRDELIASAILAKRWGLDDRAIFSAGAAEERRALHLRFPILHEDEVRRAAEVNRIDPAWVYGVMRRESAYIADVRSFAGAIGLMQLMPATALEVARMKGWSSRFDLTNPRTNIEFGTFYLRHVLDELDQHVALATASYNAGPSRVRQWLRDEQLPVDVWIDTIPFTETRRYVRAVLAYTAIYEWHLTGEPVRFRYKLKPVPAAAGA